MILYLKLKEDAPFVYELDVFVQDSDLPLQRKRSGAWLDDRRTLFTQVQEGFPYKQRHYTLRTLSRLFYSRVIRSIPSSREGPSR